MVTVQRNGVSMQIPRKLSHHIPVMPIWESVNFIDTISINYHDLNSDEFQIYKQVWTDEGHISVFFCAGGPGGVYPEQEGTLADCGQAKIQIY